METYSCLYLRPSLDGILPWKRGVWGNHASIDGFCVGDGSLYIPQSDRLLVKDFSLSVMPNDRILLLGTSGTGRTSLLRMLCGLWNPA